MQTDHSSLRYLPNQASVHRRVWKWVSILQGYDIEIQHIPGQRNPADALIRRHAQSDQRQSDAVKAEDSKLVKMLQVPEDASDADIQRVLDQVYNRPRQDQDSVTSAVVTTQDSVDDHSAQCCVTRTTVEVSADLRKKMQ